MTTPTQTRAPSLRPYLAALALILLPLLLFGGIGAWALWTEGHLKWLPWSLPVCWGLAWLLIRRANRFEFPLPDAGSREHWTPRDEQAGAIVEAEERRLDGVTGEQLTQPAFYQARTLDLARKLARHYHPNAADPLDHLSVVELLTVTQLVAEDLEEWVQSYVPGSHLITVAQWKSLAHAPDLWKTLTNLGWLATIAINPAAGLSRYAASRAFVDPATKQLQAGLLAVFFTLYLRKVGYYLIELNSGRLRGGTVRYRRAMSRLDPITGAVAAAETAPEPVTVTIAVIGQTKAGKSSLVNALLGEQRAAVDILPTTRGTRRYELTLEESRDRLVLLDTPGSNDDATGDLVATRDAVRQADLILLVMAATSPARADDARLLKELNGWFREQHRLKPPPIVGVLTKIDGLRPVMEWQPPYDWQSPSRPKETAIQDAIRYTREALDDSLPLIVPVCAEQGREYGIEEWLIPTLLIQLDEARAVSLVRSLHQEHDQARLKTTLSQFVQAGRKITDQIRKSWQPRSSQ